ncbi:hypothetical protein DH2020_039757 [Rehmannia glutinosa]|uniref:CCHC-type domain-containing protein n=1 Tax=Rehmannia glutinosa TaxID=99300 RepID=A0ABR0UUV3_REHGL
MEKDMVDKLNRFSLSVEDRSDISLEEKDIVKSKEKCGRNLLGKLFGTKKSNFAGLKFTMLKIWLTKEAFSMKEVGQNLFQFIFESQEDKLRVLRGKSWSFDNQYLIIREWSDKILDQADSITSTKLWVQVWNIPIQWITVKMGRKIGLKFGGILDVNIPEFGSPNGRSIRILVDINLEKPLLRGSYISLGVESCWVDFTYENLQGFCFYCSRVGHLDRTCYIRKEDIQLGNICEGQFGEWLQAIENSVIRTPIRNVRTQVPKESSDHNLNVKESTSGDVIELVGDRNKELDSKEHSTAARNKGVELINLSL